jgi:tetratricopeptide (TPR) repeat protein
VTGDGGRLPAAAAAVLLVLLGLAVFLPTAGHGPVDYDDRAVLAATAGGVSAGGVRWAFVESFGHKGSYYPLSWLSHLLDASLFGQAIGLHHLTSVALHLGAALLLLWWLRGLTGRLFPSAAAALLFAVHPLHVESVAWVAERKDVLSALLWMGTLSAWTRYVRRPRAGPYLAALLLCALALLAKPMAVSLPFVLLLLDFWPLGRGRGGGARLGLLAEKTPFLLLACADAVVTFLAQRAGEAVVSLRAVPAADRLGNALWSYLAYLAQAAFPVGLSVFYPHPGRPTSWRVAAGVLAVAGLTLVALLARRSRPSLLAGWLWYLGTLVPVIGLVQVGFQGRADRYTYLPLVGIFLAVAWLAGDAAPRGAAVTRVAIPSLAAIFLLAAVAGRQVGYWRDSATLFARSLAVTRGNWLAHLKLGNVEARRGRGAEAEAHYRETIRLRPDQGEAHHNLGALLAGRGRLEEAVAHLRTAVALLPGEAEARLNLAGALQETGRISEAREEFRRAVSLFPGDPRAARRLAELEAGGGNRR